MAPAHAFNGVVIACALFVLCSGASVHAQFSAKVYHDGGKSNEWPGKMIKTGDGNVAMCGYADSVLVSYSVDENGARLPNTDTRIMIMNTHVMKMTPDGRTIWKRVFWNGVRSTGQMCAKSLAQTDDGGFVVTGWERERVLIRLVNGVEQYPVDPGVTYAFVLRLDKDGNELWRTRLIPHGECTDQYSPTLHPNAVRSSGADIIVKRTVGQQTNGNIVVLGVAEMLSQVGSYQDDGEVRSMPLMGTCFQSDQNGSKYLWVIELRENDTKVRDFCTTAKPDDGSPTHKIDETARIDSKVPAIVRTKLFFPSTADGSGKFGIEYTFDFRQVTDPGTTALSHIQRNGVNQDQVFASFTKVLGINEIDNQRNSLEDGYAITVNAKANGQIGPKEDKISAARGFTILRIGDDLESRWWKLYFTRTKGEIKGSTKGVVLSLKANDIIHFRGEHTGLRSFDLCGEIQHDYTAPDFVSWTDAMRQDNRGVMYARICTDGSLCSLSHVTEYQSKTVPALPTYVRNETAYSLAQYENNEYPLSDMGVIIYGSRYATESVEPGYAASGQRLTSQGWILSFGFVKKTPYLASSVSLGKNKDNILVSGVCYPYEGDWSPRDISSKSMALGCASADDYGMSRSDRTDVWVSKLGTRCMYDDTSCGSLSVPYYERYRNLESFDIQHTTCNESAMVFVGPFCGKRVVQGEQDCP